MDQSTLLSFVVKGGVALLVMNEVRGLVLTFPVFYGVYQAGGTIAAIWIGISSLGGIALSVFAPVFVARKIAAAAKQRQLPGVSQLPLARADA